MNSGTSQPENVPSQNNPRRQFLKKVGMVGTAIPISTWVNEMSNTQSNSPAATRDSQTSSGEIPRRPLGRTGVTVSALALGGHHLGDAKDVDEAIDAGVTFFDNCWEYHNGKSEDWLGRALRGGTTKSL